MSLLKFNFPRNVSPPDRYRHVCPSGHVVKADEKGLWFRQIEKFYKDNDIPLPENWQEEFEDRLCRILPPGQCVYEDGSAPTQYIAARMTVDDLSRGMDVLMEIVQSPDPLVDQEEAERRARICASCQVNMKVNGCWSCAMVADAIARIKGARKTESDGVLQSCGICKCSSKAQVWIKPELLAKGVTGEQMEQFATIKHCWKYEALQNNQQPS